MYRSIYSLNMDTELRRDMEEVCKEMGMSLNTALVLFMKKVVRDRKIPFEITADPLTDDKKPWNLTSDNDE